MDRASSGFLRNQNWLGFQHRCGISAPVRRKPVPEWFPAPVRNRVRNFRTVAVAETSSGFRIYAETRTGFQFEFELLLSPINFRLYGLLMELCDLDGALEDGVVLCEGSKPCVNDHNHHICADVMLGASRDVVLVDWSLGGLDPTIGDIGGAVLVSEATVVWIMNSDQEAERDV
nr:hypothetical protein Iba_chr14bCG4980 [Ipomoea batatas]